jgi:hypothetical protein
VAGCRRLRELQTTVKSKLFTFEGAAGAHTVSVRSNGAYLPIYQYVPLPFRFEAGSTPADLRAIFIKFRVSAVRKPRGYCARPLSDGLPVCLSVCLRVRRTRCRLPRDPRRRCGITGSTSLTARRT